MKDKIIKKYSGKNQDYTLILSDDVYQIMYSSKDNLRNGYILATTNMIKCWKTLKGALKAWDKNISNFDK